MAVTVNWDIRTTGSSSNGGGFDTSSSGTDYSQQDTAQVSYTDLVIGATNTQLTSAAHPFTSAHVGNVINITGGTGFTVARYRVVSVASAVATMDRAVGTASSTGGIGNLGGAINDLQTAITANFAAINVGSGQYDVMWVKAGTYTRTTSLNPSSYSSGSPLYCVIGYNATHGDNPTGSSRPLITTATNGLALVSFNAANVSFYCANVSFSHTAATRGYGFDATNQNPPGLNLYNCSLDGFTSGIHGDFSVNYLFTWIFLDGCEVKNCSANGLINGAGAACTVTIVNSSFHDNAGPGIVLKSFAWLRCESTLITNNTIGIDNSASGGVPLMLRNCTIANNSGDGAKTAAFIGTPNAYQEWHISNNIFYGNGGYGFNQTTASSTSLPGQLMHHNAFGGNTTADRNNMATGAGDVALTANPFTSSSDYALNSTAGGGAACKAAASPSAFTTSTTSYLDLGAIQSQGSSGGSGPINYGFIG